MRINDVFVEGKPEMSKSVPEANRQWSRSVRALHLLGSVLLSGGILAGLGSFAFAQSAAAGPAAGAMQVVGGRLAWGFTQTLQGEPPSAWPSITVGHGAVRERDGTIDFSSAGGSYDSASGTATMKYRGTATLTYRTGQVTVANPTVTIGRTGTALRADLRTTPSKAQKAIRSAQADVGTMEMSGVAPRLAARTVTWSEVPTTLTATGAAAFPDGFEGASLGPTTFAATLAAASQPQAQPQANPPANRPNARSATTPSLPINPPVPNVNPNAPGTGGTGGTGGGATPGTSECPTPSPGASFSGTGSATPSPTTTNCATSATPSSAPTGSSGPPAKLAKTGGPLAPLAIFGIALTVAGVGTMVSARRRARAQRRRCVY